MSRRAPAGGARPGAPGADDPAVRQARTADRLTAFRLFAEVWTILECRATAQVASFGLLPIEFEVLLRLARSPMGRLRMSDLVAQTSLTSSGVTRVVDRLMARGLVCRQACDGDRRSTYTVMTEAGGHTLAEVLPGHVEVIERFFAGPLREAGDFEELARILGGLRDRLHPGATAGGEPSRRPGAVATPAAAGQGQPG